MAKRFVISLFLMLVALAVLAQQKSRFNFFRYSVNEGLLQSTVNDLAVDKNNFCWLSFSNGIQKFDGNNFKNIPIQAGLPDDKKVTFFKQKNNVLLIAHSHGISRYDIDKEKFELVFRLPVGTIDNLYILGESNNRLYVFLSSGIIVTLNAGNFAPLAKNSILPYLKNYRESVLPTFSNIENDQICVVYNQTLFLFQLHEFKLVAQNQPRLGIYYTSYTLLPSGKILCFVQDGIWQLVSYDIVTNQFTTLFKSQPNNLNFRGYFYNRDGKSMISYYDKLIFLSNQLVKDSSYIVDFKNNSISGDNVFIVKVVADNFGNLYMVTLNDGIRKLIHDSYPIAYYGKESLGKNYVLSVYPDKKNNRIFLGTRDKGLMIFDTLQNFIRHIPRLPGDSQPYSVNNIVKLKNGDYIFLAISKPGAYQLSANLQTIIARPVQEVPPVSYPQPRYFSKMVYEDDDKAILQTEINFYTINKATGSIKLNEVYNGFTHGSILYKGKLIVHSNDSIREYDTSNFKVVKTIPFPNTYLVRCYASMDNRLYFGCNNGLFITDENYRIISRLNRSNGLPDDCIYAMMFDSNKNLWCSSNKGIFRISPNGTIFRLTREDGLQENEFNTNAFYKTATGEFFWGGTHGANSFYPGFISGVTNVPDLYVTEIKVNNRPYQVDTALQALKEISLPYDENSFAISFIASGSQNTSRYIHQYKLEGWENEWVPLPMGDPVRFTLPPGEYVLKMYAGLYFDDKAHAAKTLRIIIHPPFWKTWWFISLVAAVIIGIIIFIITRYTRARYQKRLAAMLLVQKLQEERGRISMELHDSIGAYANAVLYNTDLLQAESRVKQKNRLLKDLRFASKDIITSLRETIWALKNEVFTAQECFMRIRNFVQSLSRYYPNIQFRVEGDAPQQKQLHYSAALNIVRIVQEVVNNAIKHGNPDHIHISSSIDGEQWLLQIDDDGIGFNSSMASMGNGMDNIKRRAADSKLDVQLQSAPGKGTHILISIPG